MKLECCSSLSKEEQELYEELGVDIFRTHPPRNKTTSLVCPKCDTSFNEWYYYIV